jgi:hypothetical protein
MINGKQHTVAQHVDNLKSSYVDPKVIKLSNKAQQKVKWSQQMIIFGLNNSLKLKNMKSK